MGEEKWTLKVIGRGEMKEKSTFKVIGRGEMKEKLFSEGLWESRKEGRSNSADFVGPTPADSFF